MEFIYGQTADDMRETGRMGNSMEKESIFYRMEQLRLEFGKKENE